jgi:hypothetical protein
MMTLLTRHGDGCRIVVTGDLDQGDAAALYGGRGGGDGGNRGGGLRDLVMRLRGEAGGGYLAAALTAAAARSNFELVELDEGDVQRSGVVRDVLALYRIGGSAHRR